MPAEIFKPKDHSEGLTNIQEMLLLQLFEIGAIKFGNFKLKIHDKYPEAPLSPLYIDLRTLRRFPEAKNTAVNIYQELVKPLKFDLLADIPTAATPLVSSLADKLQIGMVTPRTDLKGHGSGAKIDGFLTTDKGKTAVLIDDLVTKADSKLEAANILSREGLIVKDVVVLIDREQGGKEQLAENGFTLHSAIRLSEMFDFYTKVGKIGQNKKNEIVQNLQTLNNYLAIQKNQSQ